MSEPVLDVPLITGRIALLAALMWASLGGCAEARHAAPHEPQRLHRIEGGRAVVIPDRGGTTESDWTMPARDFASTRFSPLQDINVANARTLRLAWSLPLGAERGEEAAPLVVADTMYVVTPYPNTLFAIDLTHPPNVRWQYHPPTLPAAQGEACCDVVNRGAAYSNGRIFYNTLDAQTVAVDAASGHEIWRTRLGDIHRGETMTMAPLVVGDRVLVGNSGGEFGVRGWLTALDAGSGAQVWRAYSTGPDRDVLIGPGFHPFYEHDRGTDLGVNTWPPGRWQTGGGTAWGWISYDPDVDLVYYGTSNPSPWNAEQRPGDNKWTAGIFARRPRTGEAVWFYQYNPHDLYDYDGVNENVLVDLEIAGARRRVLLHPDRNGYVYVLDRMTGEVLSAAAFVHVNTTDGVDPHTGRPREVAAYRPRIGHVVRDICPAAAGGKDWQPSAFSPRTGWLYIPHNNLCQDEEGVEANYIAGTPFVGANVRMHAGPGGNRGAFTAWDPVNARAAWSVRENFPVWSGALATAGDVVFYGTMDGWFKALDAHTGERLWQFHTESGVIGQPVTYRGPDGHQYVAVLAGVGGWAGAVLAGSLDTHDQSAALGTANAMSDLAQHTQRGGRLYVFALP